jgi:hypothetical protein
MNWVLKHFLAYLFQNTAEASFTVVKHCVRWFFIINLYLHPKPILYVCYKKQSNRYTNSFYTSDTNKCCQKFAGFRGLCFIGSAWSEQIQQECRLQHVVTLTLIHVKSLWHTVNCLKACHNVFMETFHTLILGINVPEIWNVPTNKNPVNLGHGGMEAMQLVHLHIQWAGQVWFRN